MLHTIAGGIPARYTLSLFFLILNGPALAAPADTEADLRALNDRVRQLEQQQSADRPQSRANAFNPEISLVLSGVYGTLQRDPAIAPTGFALSPSNVAQGRGFNLGESELMIASDIDPLFRGLATFALSPAGGVTVENGYVTTQALGNGLSLKFGRFFSGLGYLNEQHAHAWDFVDQPLVYRNFWDNQLGDDGIQLKWLAPTDMYLEWGAEAGSGRGFPGSAPQKNGSAAGTLYFHLGDDLGVSHSWRAGASYHQTTELNWLGSVDTPAGLPTAASFSGPVRTAGLDLVWKYAPNGNATVTNFKFQGEYFRRSSNGWLAVTPPVGATLTDRYDVIQSGWYVQGVYQFMPRWRAGLRHDRLDSGRAQLGTALIASVTADHQYTPQRDTLMLDYLPSEFSRLRLQLARDASRQGLPDNQLFFQYTMSMGAHGAHLF